MVRLSCAAAWELPQPNQPFLEPSIWELRPVPAWKNSWNVQCLEDEIPGSWCLSLKERACFI